MSSTFSLTHCKFVVSRGSRRSASFQSHRKSCKSSLSVWRTSTQAFCTLHRHVHWSCSLGVGNVRYQYFNITSFRHNLVYQASAPWFPQLKRRKKDITKANFDFKTPRKTPWICVSVERPRLFQNCFKANFLSLLSLHENWWAFWGLGGSIMPFLALQREV